MDLLTCYRLWNCWLKIHHKDMLVQFICKVKPVMNCCNFGIARIFCVELLTILKLVGYVTRDIGHILVRVCFSLFT